MRKTIAIVVATVLVAAALGVWASASRPAKSAAIGVQDTAGATIDPFALTKDRKDLPTQHVETPF